MHRSRRLPAVLTVLAAAAGAPADHLVVINEFVANHVGSDTHEFLEIFGEPSTDLSALRLLQLEGDSRAGTIDTVLAPDVTDRRGFWTSPFMQDEFENGTMTLLLVEGFTGNKGDDLDTNNDGVLDATPWAQLIDAVGVFDGGSSDGNYGFDSILNPDFDGGTFTVGGASRIPNGSDTNSIRDWLRNDFDGEGLPGFTGTPVDGEAYNTPHDFNRAVPEPATLSLFALAALVVGRRAQR